MVGRCMNKNEHIIDSNMGQGTHKSNDHLGKYQTLGMYPVGSCACLKQELAQHLLSYHPATNGAKKELMEIMVLLSKSTGTKQQTQWMHGILKLWAIPFGVPSCHLWDRRFRTIIGAYNS